MKSKLLSLAFKVESISSFCSFSTSNVAGQENQISVRDIGENIKLEKCGRNDHNSPAFPIAKIYKDESREGQKQHDF